MALPDIDLHRVRPHGNPPSRAGGFEELASILLCSDLITWPRGTEFSRFGNPDGGREGRGVLPDGSVWAWQAKYLFRFDASAGSKVSSSVERALEREPRLTKYFVALPIDLPAGDTATQTSAHTRWEAKVKEWSALARSRDMDLEFVFIGEHELVSALTLPSNEGRLRYWFDTDLLGQAAQEQHLSDQLARARDRYDARLHVDVAPTSALDGLGRSESHTNRWREVLADLRRALRVGWRNPADETDAEFQALHEAVSSAVAACEDADSALAQRVDALSGSFEPSDVDAPLATAAKRLGDVMDLLREHRRRDVGYVGEDAHLYSSVRSASSAVHAAQALARSPAAAASHSRFLLVTGKGGTGKTHLLCHTAEERVSRGLPTVLLLGQQFTTAAPFHEMARLAGLGDRGRDVLAVLDAAGEAAGCMALLIIDAINESDPPLAWRDDLAVLRSATNEYSHVGIAVACRSEFLEGLVDPGLDPRVEHHGLGESADEALVRYCEHFGLDYPTFPPLNPEFANPWYLKLVCRSMLALGETRFQRGAQGLSAVCDSFVDAVTLTLSAPGRCDFDPKSDLVSDVVTRFAEHDDAYVDRGTAQQICDELLPNRSWSSSLLNGLLKEGLLIEAGPDRIGFGYQRLGDVARAQVTSEAGIDAVEQWLAAHAKSPWRHRGTAVALTTVVPENHGVELIDLAANEEGAVSLRLVEAFVDGLTLRSAASITDRTIEIAGRLLDEPRFANDTWAGLLRVACVPDHPLNARWLHDQLIAMELPDRDQTWSQFLTYALADDEPTAVSRLIRWAWPEDGTAPDCSGDVAALAVVTLAWMLTTTDRSVRDHATKAVVSLTDQAPGRLADELPAFAHVDDPYVTERLAAAACGVALRSTDSAPSHELADAVLELVDGDLPDHILTRDYTDRVWQTATASGWSGDPPLPATTDWPGRELPPREDIEELCQAPDYAYSSVWSSLTKWGDFGRYVLKSALDDLSRDGVNPSRDLAERDIFERVRELGWTPERFRDIDRRRTGHVPQVERVGKKYQWIGFYETIGRATDTHEVGRSWEDERRPFTHPEQVIWRDIDPTLLSHGRASWASPVTSTPWHSPIDVQFTADLTGTPSTEMDATAIPDPVGLIRIDDPTGVPWLALTTIRRWQQPLTPEEEALDLPTLEIVMSVKSFVTRQQDSSRLADWIDNKDWENNWLLRTPELHNLLMGTHPEGPRWDALGGPINFEQQGLGEAPCEVWPTSAWYGGTGTSRDASTAEPATGYVPSRWITQQLQVAQHLDYGWFDQAGRLALQDPVRAGQPAALLARQEALGSLAEDGFTLLWAVRVEKHRRQGLGTARRELDERYRWVSAHATYEFLDDEPSLICSGAARYRRGPEFDQQLEWLV